MNKTAWNFRNVSLLLTSDPIFLQLLQIYSQRKEENQQILTLKRLKPFDLKSVIRIVYDSFPQIV